MTKFIGTPLRGIEFANPGDEAISSRVSGDTQPRLRIDAGGRITWSDGTNSGDTVLFRSSANALTTYDSLTASAGLITLTTNGIPSQSLPNGAIAIDTTNHVFYFRSNNEWLEVSGGATVTVDDSPPLDPEIGDLWYSSLELELFIYYSNAWIQLTDAQGGVQELYELSDVLIDDPVYGQTLVYNGTEWENDFITTAQSLQTARAISLAGDVSGSVAFDGSQNVSISATIQPNSVALGTDTTGNYVNDLTAGTGVTITHTPGEGSSPTVAIGQSVATTASVSFAHVATNSLNVVNNIVGTGNITLSPTISSYEIGDTGPAGGKIFITPSTSGNTTGKYFEAAPVSAQVLRKWATDTDPGIGLGNAATTVVGADGTAIGTGQQNTADIVAQTGNVAATSAAVYCDEYTYGGFSDWFLPSKDELNELYVNQVVVGGFLSSYYSSSSEVSNEAFWFQSFIDGLTNTPYKNNQYYIRPVRSFVAPSPSGIITGNLTGNVTGNVTGSSGSTTGNAATATALQNARAISLSGDVSGSVSFDGSASVSISTTIQPNSVALGTDTTGNYMSGISVQNGLTVAHTPGEGSSATIGVDNALLSNFLLEGASGNSYGLIGTSAYLDVKNTNGYNKEIELDIVALETKLTTDGYLKDSSTSASVSFSRLQTSGDVVVGGDLTVNGTTTTLNTETLSIEDNIVVLNSNVTGSPTTNAGVEVERGTSNNVVMRWNESADRWDFTNDGSTYNNVLLLSDIGQDSLNDTVITTPLTHQSITYNGTNWVNEFASTITYARNVEANALSVGEVVYLFGATGDRASVKRASNSSEATSSKTVGVVSVGGAAGADVTITTLGYVSGISLGSYTAGDVLWLGSTAGTFTTTKPTAPNHLVFIGVVAKANAGNGIMYVKCQNGYEINELHDVQINGVTDGQFLRYNSASTVWVNDTINLGTDTVGDYMSDLTQGTGVTITHTPGEGSNATVAIGQDVATSASVTFANVTATGNVAISGRIDKTTIRESVADTSVSASVVTADYSTGDIFYVGTAPSSNFTVNLTNAPTDNGKAITVVIFVTQGATGYYPNVVQVAGSAQTIKWANGAAPTPTSSAGKIDIFSFTFVRRSSAWTVFGSSNLGY